MPIAGHLATPARTGALLQDTISALNVMATGDLSECEPGPGGWEMHEDISAEHQPAQAATAGRAFYEVGAPAPPRPPPPRGALCPRFHLGSQSCRFLFVPRKPASPDTKAVCLSW